MHDFMPAVVSIAFFTLIVLVVSIVSNNRLKKRLIETNRMDPESIKLISKPHFVFKLDALKWGLVLFFFGLGLVLIEYLPYGDNSPLPIGVVTISTSLGFLIYYFSIRKEKTNVE